MHLTQNFPIVMFAFVSFSVQLKRKNQTNKLRKITRTSKLVYRGQKVR